jgi:hypothetical protein
MGKVTRPCLRLPKEEDVLAERLLTREEVDRIIAAE